LCSRLGKRLFALLKLGVDPAVELLVLGGKEVFEREVGQLGLELPHAEPVRERREDLERLARNRRSLLDGHPLQRAHVVQPIGELDHDDAPVVRHGNEHRAKVLDLLLDL
jgi:hypothetical protein